MTPRGVASGTDPGRPAGFRSYKYFRPYLEAWGSDTESKVLLGGAKGLRDIELTDRDGLLCCFTVQDLVEEGGEKCRKAWFP